MLISAHEMEAKNIYVLKWFEIYTRVLASSTIVVDMPCDKREQTVVSVSHMYRHICAIDHLVGRVYRHMSAYVNLAGHVVSSTKMAIHTLAVCIASFLTLYLVAISDYMGQVRGLLYGCCVACAAGVADA